MAPEEITAVEAMANAYVLQNSPVETRLMALEDAMETGARALFGEKYGDEVRVVSMGVADGGQGAGKANKAWSVELCGGTHVARTGDIGICKIVYEGSISAGVRRIEAITGEGALQRFQQALEQQAKFAGVDLEKLMAREKALEHELQQLKTKAAQAGAGDLESQARDIKGVKVLSAQVAGFDRAQLRTLVDSLRNKWQAGAVVVLAAVDGSNVSIISGVTKELSSKVHAGKLAGAVAAATGGKGGGRPDMAEAGGKDPSALGKALDQVYSDVEGML
jgi:alanyl-tRNA synthetase